MLVRCDDGRVVRGSHALLAIGSIPNSDGLGLEHAGVAVDADGYVGINHHCQSNVPHIYAAGDLSGKLPLSSVAAMQGRKVAEHVMGLHTRDHRHLDYDKAASAIFTEPEIADVGLAEAEAFATGRKIRVTKVPFSANAKALIDGDPAGLRQDPVRPGHRRGARRVDRGPPRRRADLGHRPRRHLQPEGGRHRRERHGPSDPRRSAGRCRRIRGPKGRPGWSSSGPAPICSACPTASTGTPRSASRRSGRPPGPPAPCPTPGSRWPWASCDLPTAFVATAGSGPLHIGICAEYDALPGIGHACGHNVICAAAVGAGLALQGLADDLGLTVTVFGTPAEEGGGGKILMLERGAFAGVHAAMMVHPAPLEQDVMGCLAVAHLEVAYHGKAAHASAYPEQGINAADAITVAQTAIGLLRQHIGPSDRIHGIVTHGGDAPNIVPGPHHGQLLRPVPHPRRAGRARAEGAPLLRGGGAGDRLHRRGPARVPGLLRDAGRSAS